MNFLFMPFYLLVAQGTFTSFFIYTTFYKADSTGPAYQPSLRYQLECRGPSSSSEGAPGGGYFWSYRFRRNYASEYFIQLQFIPPVAGNYCLTSAKPKHQSLNPKRIERFTFELCYQPDVQAVEADYCKEHWEQFLDEEFLANDEAQVNQIRKQIPRIHLNGSFLVRSVAICGVDRFEQRIPSEFHHVTTSKEDWTKNCL